MRPDRKNRPSWCLAIPSPRHAVHSRHVRVPGPRGEGLRERLGGELGRGLGIKRPAREVTQQILGMAAIELHERRGIVPRSQEQRRVAPLIHPVSDAGRGFPVPLTGPCHGGAAA